MRRPFVSKQGRAFILMQGVSAGTVIVHVVWYTEAADAERIWFPFAVQAVVAAPPAPVAKPQKGQTSHADDVAAKDAPLRSLFPSEPKVAKVLDISRLLSYS